jgi:hypothetical protein
VVIVDRKANSSLPGATTAAAAASNSELTKTNLLLTLDGDLANTSVAAVQASIVAATGAPPASVTVTLRAGAAAVGDPASECK